MRISRAPERYEPDEMPEDDVDLQEEDDMLHQDEGDADDEMSSAGSSDSAGSLVDFVDDEIVYESDLDDPDWEEEVEADSETDEAGDEE